MRSAWACWLSLLLVGCPGESKDLAEDSSDTCCVIDCSADADGDGFDICDDCDDDDALIKPEADEVCDGVDNDCDGEVDEDGLNITYEDDDGDGYGDDASMRSWDTCEVSGGVPTGGDCDDEDPYVYPGAEERCDEVDNDCDDETDEGFATSTFYRDYDEDGFGSPDAPTEACRQPDGYADNALDCLDVDATEPVWADATTGSPAGTGTAADPFDTIQACIDQAGFCCNVAAGTYVEDIDFDGKSILVTGVDGAEATTIVGTGTDAVVTIASGETAGAELSGFTIAGGTGALSVYTEYESVYDEDEDYLVLITTYYHLGGGVYIDGASPTLHDLVITENLLPDYYYTELPDHEYVYVYSYGGGIFVYDATVAWWDIRLVDNEADSGGGLYVGGSATVDASYLVFDGNQASGGGGLSVAGVASLDHSLFVDNLATSEGSVLGGAAAHVDEGALLLDQVTAASNEGHSSVFVASEGWINLWNSILVDNDGGPLLDAESGARIELGYSDLWGGTEETVWMDGTALLSADPLFTLWTDNDDASDDDLNLSAGSPAIGVGEDGADMGAYGGEADGW